MGLSKNLHTNVYDGIIHSDKKAETKPISTNCLGQISKIRHIHIMKDIVQPQKEMLQHGRITC